MSFFKKQLKNFLGKNIDGVENTPFVFFMRLCFGVLAALIIDQFSASSMDAFFYDLRVQLQPKTSGSKNIVLIVSNQQTTTQLGKVPGLTEHALLLRQLQGVDSKKIVYFTDLLTLQGSKNDTQTFLKAASELKNLIVAVDETEVGGAVPLKLTSPFESLNVEASPTTRDKNVLSKDSVTRRILLSYQGSSYLYQKLAALYNPVVADLSGVTGVFDFLGSKQAMIDFGRGDRFQFLAFEDVLAGKIDKNQLAGKLIFIGDDHKQSFANYAATPLDPSPGAMTRAELNAHMTETLISNSAPQHLAKWWDLLITIVVAVFTVQLVLTAKPLKGISVLIGFVAVFCFVSFLVFYFLGYVVEMSHPLLAIFLCYYFFIPYRLIIENRRSWEYYQKHKLLSEVETLKTNFVGMMSHDLKTPLARIQGMVEVIKKDEHAVSLVQEEALDSIKSSTQDLIKFIDTILNYTKIESQGVELHLESRDLNQLLKEVLKKLEFLARSKQIEFVLELEPLFSISLDPELIKQVLGNLIENAIKYSPQSSKILISTEERDAHVIVQIADQGKGIPEDELANIFTKFYRSKEAKVSSVKGSGLGLYLAKYFVELHHGSISVESTVNVGSTFTIKLPV
jgi:signal transduction histidine kinase